MKKIFTKEYIMEHRGCYEKEDVLSLSFIDNETITIEDILNSEINTHSKIWFVYFKCELKARQRNKLGHINFLYLKFYNKNNYKIKIKEELLRFVKNN